MSDSEARNASTYDYESSDHDASASSSAPPPASPPSSSAAPPSDSHSHPSFTSEAPREAVGNGRLPNLAYKVYIGNLPPGVTEREVEDLFRECPVRCATPARIDLKAQGYAFVHFQTSEGLEEALPKISGSEMHGSRIRAEWSRPPSTKCFVCKRDGHWARDCPENSNRPGGGGGDRRGPGPGRMGGRDDRSYSGPPGRPVGRDYERGRSPIRAYGGGGGGGGGGRSDYGGGRDRSPPPRRGYSPPPLPRDSYDRSRSGGATASGGYGAAAGSYAAYAPPPGPYPNSGYPPAPAHYGNSPHYPSPSDPYNAHYATRPYY